MHIVRDSDGCHYVLLEEGQPTCRVREIPSGEQTTIPCAELSTVEPAAALDALGIQGDDRETLREIGSVRAIGLLFELEATGPLSVRALLDQFDICESAFNGVTTELRAAGCIEPTTVYGERGYRVTDTAREALGTREQS